MRRLLSAFLAATLALAVAAQSDPRSIVLDGALLLQQGRAGEAETLFRRAAALATSDPVPWSWLGRSLLAQDRHAAACEALQKALDLDEKVPGLGRTLKRETSDALGLAWAYQREFSKAREVYARALASDPGYAVLRYNLACVCSLDGDRSGALSNLAAYLDGSKDLPVGTAVVDASQDEDFKGLLGDPAFEGLLRERVGRQPNDTAASALVRAGAGALGRGRTAEALEQLERAVQTDAGDPRAWYYRAGALAADGKVAAAGESYEKAIVLSVPPRVWLTRPMVRWAALAAGKARLVAKDAKGAVPLLEQARDLDAYRPAAFYELGRARAALGDGPAALEAVKRAQALSESLLPVEGRLPEPASDPVFAPFKGQPGWDAVFPDAGASGKKP